MLILMRTWCPEDLDQYSFAIFKIEIGEARMLAQKHAVFRLMATSHNEVVEIVFKTNQETTCEFFAEVSITDKELEATATTEIDDKGWTLLPHGFNPDVTPRDASPTSATYLVLCEKGFYWKGMADEGGDIDTEVIPYELLQQVL